MAMTAAEILVKVTADTSGLERGLSDASRKVGGFADGLTSKLTRGVGGAFKGLGTMALKGAAVAGTALAGMGAAAISAAAEAESVAAQTAAAIESTGGAANVTASDIDSLSQSIMQMSGISDEAVGSAANLLLTFTNIRNETGAGNDVFNQATTAIADLSTRMGGDMQGAAIQVGKALNDPIKGITALSRVGVSFTEDQKAQIKALAETGDMMGAQKVILAELSKEFGGSAKAAGETFTGQLNIAKETIGNTMEEIGGSLITAIGPALPKLAKVLGDVFKKLGPTIGRVVDGIGTVLAALTPIIEPLLDTLGTAFIQIIEALAPAIGPVTEALLALIQAIVPILPPVAKLIGALLPPLANLLAKYVAPALEVVVGWLSKAVDWVTGFVSTIGSAPGKIASAFGRIRDAIITAFKAAINFVIKAWNALDFGLNLTIPDWVPLVGGKGFNVDDIFPDIPYLAKGGIVTRPTLAMVGERGPEAVVPLSGGGASNTLSVNVVIDRRTFARQTDYKLRAAGF